MEGRRQPTEAPWVRIAMLDPGAIPAAGVVLVVHGSLVGLVTLHAYGVAAPFAYLSIALGLLLLAPRTTRLLASHWAARRRRGVGRATSPYRQGCGSAAAPRAKHWSRLWPLLPAALAFVAYLRLWGALLAFASPGRGWCGTPLYHRWFSELLFGGLVAVVVGFANVWGAHVTSRAARLARGAFWCLLVTLVSHAVLQAHVSGASIASLLLAR